MVGFEMFDKEASMGKFEGVEGRMTIQQPLNRHTEFKLLKNERIENSLVELNLLDRVDPESPNIVEPVVEASSSIKTEVEKRTFKCKYCIKKFSNSQALGGHQNAHKHERALMKKEKGANDGQIDHFAYPFTNPYMYPYPSFRRVSLNPLGVNPQSMIHKPIHMGPSYSRHNGWPRSNFVGLRFDPSNGSGRIWAQNSSLSGPDSILVLEQTQPSLPPAPPMGLNLCPNQETNSQARPGPGLASLPMVRTRQDNNDQSLPSLCLKL